jgi:hypothetical protein
MRVRLDRYETANRSMANRTTILFVLGGIGVVIAAFGLFMGVAMIVMPEKDAGDGLWARRAGIFLTFFFGIVPGAVSTLFIGYGARQRERYRRLGELAAVARQGGGLLTTNDVAHGLGTTPQLADRLIVDAAALGLIEHGPSPQATAAPPLPSHVVYPASLAPTVAAPSVVPATPPRRESPASVIVAPGSVLAETYRIEEPLGRGGMGEVFAARHLRTGRRYAVKTILGGPRADEAAFRRFEREATAASALGHPGIIQVHDFNATSGGTFYLVMDLLEGETLEKRLEGGPLAWPDVQRIGLEHWPRAVLRAGHRTRARSHPSRHQTEQRVPRIVEGLSRAMCPRRLRPREAAPRIRLAPHQHGRRSRNTHVHVSRAGPG